jgi:hypothetical protein
VALEEVREGADGRETTGGSTMRRIAIASLTLVVLLAVSAAVAGTASAKRLILRSEEGTVLTPSDELRFSGIENLAVYSTDGFLSECRSAEFQEMNIYAALDDVSGKRDTIRFFEREPLGTEMQVGPCESDDGNALVFFDWDNESLTLGADGRATLRPVSIGVDFEGKGGSESEELSCSYLTKALSGTNTATPTRQPLAPVDLSGELTRHDSPRACPKAIHMSLALTSIVVYGPIYEGYVEEELL